LANLFGNTVLSEELLDLVGEPRDRKRQAGFTKRLQKSPYGSGPALERPRCLSKDRREVPLLLARHREPLAP